MLDIEVERRPHGVEDTVQVGVQRVRDGEVDPCAVDAADGPLLGWSGLVQRERGPGMLGRTFDGLHSAGTFVEPETATGRAVVLIRGGGATREEGGFFTRLADGVAEVGVASLRFDLRAHGQGEGRREENTLSSILNGVSVAPADVQAATGTESVSLLGTSFGGGIAAYYAAERPEEITRLVLLNPQSNPGLVTTVDGSPPGGYAGRWRR